MFLNEKSTCHVFEHEAIKMSSMIVCVQARERERGKEIIELHI